MRAPSGNFLYGAAASLAFELSAYKITNYSDSQFREINHETAGENIGMDD